MGEGPGALAGTEGLEIGELPCVDDHSPLGPLCASEFLLCTNSEAKCLLPILCLDFFIADF